MLYSPSLVSASSPRYIAVMFLLIVLLEQVKSTWRVSNLVKFIMLFHLCFVKAILSFLPLTDETVILPVTSSVTLTCFQ